MMHTKLDYVIFFLQFLGEGGIFTVTYLLIQAGDKVKVGSLFIALEWVRDKSLSLLQPHLVSFVYFFLVEKKNKKVWKKQPTGS